MKIATVLGTRPEIIRLSCIIPKIDAICDHVLVHTGQNFDPALSQYFFDELSVREPDHFLGVMGSSFGEQIGQIMARCHDIFTKERPDRLLILGDTNSSLCAIIAKRMGIRVYHMEAGNRCFDDRVPEEVNRRAIDHSSDVLMPYTERSRANLVREGIEHSRIFVTGNPIKEVIDRHAATDRLEAFDKAGVSKNGYILTTLHRAENVDDPVRLTQFLEALTKVQERFERPVIVSTHPRTRQKLERLDKGVQSNPNLRFLEPFGFPDFITLQRHAFCVLTDSGTVQEETCIFHVPSVTLRDATERQETLECGSNIVAGSDPDAIVRSVIAATSEGRRWQPPPEYLSGNVSEVVLNTLLSTELS